MEPLKHECGVAIIRLLKPLEYYERKYGTWMYGLNKLYLLMEKQHNRGQEGAGLACVKLKSYPGEEYMFRERAEGSGAITEIFNNVNESIRALGGDVNDAAYAERYLPFAGNVYMGHLRYSTTGKAGLTYVHPFLRRNNWRAKNLALCGNFNLTNVDEIFAKITATGQHPRKYSDTYIMLEQVGHRLDRESERLFDEAVAKGLTGTDITDYIENNINMANVLRKASPDWDGGYVICGLTGSGETFAIRDPWGIRPAFWYADDEVAVLASERPVIQTVFDLKAHQITELLPGQALLISKAGEIRTEQVNQPVEPPRACSFERIYFSRGSDVDIYRERKTLGRELVPHILEAVDNDIDNMVLSFIPNTAEVAFYGMMQGFEEHLNNQKIREIAALGANPDPAELNRILARTVRCEKVAIKDIKLRTFITEGNSRDDLAAHVYDITYGSIVPGVDNLVVIDDSIVRGTTLRQSIIKILDRLEPKKIVIVSSSPQVRYPDYYGIDMSRMSEFIAFKAAIELLRERGLEHIIDEVYEKSRRQLENPGTAPENFVKEIYAPFTDVEISRKIAEMLTPPGVKSKVEIVYQPLEGLRKACPNHRGDWYFSGDYPTPGGIRMVSRAFIDFVDDMRASDKQSDNQ